MSKINKKSRLELHFKKEVNKEQKNAERKKRNADIDLSLAPIFVLFNGNWPQKVKYRRNSKRTLSLFSVCSTLLHISRYH